MTDPASGEPLAGSTVVHFAAPVHNAPGLIDWAKTRRPSLDHDIVLDAITLTRFRYRATG